jgi:hypothetical protein
VTGDVTDPDPAPTLDRDDIEVVTADLGARVMCVEISSPLTIGCLGKSAVWRLVAISISCDIT